MEISPPGRDNNIIEGTETGIMLDFHIKYREPYGLDNIYDLNFLQTKPAMCFYFKPLNHLPNNDGNAIKHVFDMQIEKFI